MQVLHFPHVTIGRATEAAQLTKGICVQMQAPSYAGRKQQNTNEICVTLLY